MINIKKAKQFCCGNIEDIENYAQAMAYEHKIWDCHHKKGEDGRSREQLKEDNEYYNVPPEDLIFLTRSEHTKRHIKYRDRLVGEKNPMWGKHPSEETRKKLSEAAKHRLPWSEERRKKQSDRLLKDHPMRGKHPSEETRKKLSEAAKKRTKKCRYVQIDEKKLRELYYVERLPKKDIAKILGCSKDTIDRKIAEYRMDKRKS